MSKHQSLISMCHIQFIISKSKSRELRSVYSFHSLIFSFQPPMPPINFRIQLPLLIYLLRILKMLTSTLHYQGAILIGFRDPNSNYWVTPFMLPSLLFFRGDLKFIYLYHQSLLKVIHFHFSNYHYPFTMFQINLIIIKIIRVNLIDLIIVNSSHPYLTILIKR